MQLFSWTLTQICTDSKSIFKLWYWLFPRPENFKLLLLSCVPCVVGKIHQVVVQQMRWGSLPPPPPPSPLQKWTTKHFETRNKIRCTIQWWYIFYSVCHCSCMTSSRSLHLDSNLYSNTINFFFLYMTKCVMPKKEFFLSSIFCWNKLKVRVRIETEFYFAWFIVS